jgi:hypothetical protein
MAYVRYTGIKGMEEDNLFCRPLSATTAAQDIFKTVD